MRFQVGQDILLSQLGTVAGYDVGFDCLAQHLVRHPDHRRLDDFLHFEDTLFDLLGADPEALHLNDVLFASHHVQVSVRVLSAQVAGEVEAVPQHLGGALRVFPVALHDVRTAGHYLALLAQRDRPSVFIGNENVHVRHRGADGAELGQQHGWLEVGEPGGRLGGPVHDVQLGRIKGLQGLLLLGRGHVPAGLGHIAQLRKGVVPQGGAVQ